jgi:hypothetical protein
MIVHSDFAKSILKRYVIEDTITYVLTFFWFVCSDSHRLLFVSSTSDQDASPNPQQENQDAKKIIPYFKQFPRGGPIIGLLGDNDSGYNAFITHLDKSPILVKVYVSPNIPRHSLTLKQPACISCVILLFCLRSVVPF